MLFGEMHHSGVAESFQHLVLTGGSRNDRRENMKLKPKRVLAVKAASIPFQTGESFFIKPRDIRQAAPKRRLLAEGTP